LQTRDAEDAAERWAEFDSDLGNDDVLSTGIRIGILARHRERKLARALILFGDRGVRSMDDYRLLALITRVDPQPTTASAASVIVGLSKAATAIRLERFESDGLVTRTVREFDRRTIEVRITTPGRTLAIECTHAVKRVYSEILDVFDQDEHDELRRLLLKVNSIQ